MNGTLQVKVSTADGTMAVSDAAVKIRDAQGHTVYALTSDANGMTAVVTLFAPSRHFSLSPHTSHLAYSAYEVMVTHPGYIPQFVRGVRVFDGEGSLLPVDLVARTPRTDRGDSVNIVEIPPPGASEPINFPPAGAVWGRW
ncbi:MAG: carboxypeptidase-like regulatory domain-containing protein [Oscillospiraceae bacterium]|nr:carboxypeptidase-like regulatory domain-containing protein [Oscillospiraceae bacterium]